jgi:hypothetical protein
MSAQIVEWCRKEVGFLCENLCEKIFPNSAKMWKIC